MLVLGLTCEATAMAVCNCDVYVLSKVDFDAAATSYPEDSQLVQRLTKEAYQKHQEKQQRSMRKKAPEPEDDFDDLAGDSVATPPNSPISPSAPDFQATSPPPATTAPATGARRPSFGYFVMEQSDQKRIETIKQDKRRKSITAAMNSRMSLSLASHDQRVKPVEDGTIKLVGTLGREKDEESVPSIPEADGSSASKSGSLNGAASSASSLTVPSPVDPRFGSRRPSNFLTPVLDET
jgi:hypothetical protein